jgi:hypothetical protein
VLEAIEKLPSEQRAVITERLELALPEISTASIMSMPSPVNRLSALPSCGRARAPARSARTRARSAYSTQRQRRAPAYGMERRRVTVG